MSDKRSSWMSRSRQAKTCSTRFVNRATTQPGQAFFTQTFGAFAASREAVAYATSLADFTQRMESAGVWLRLDAAMIWQLDPSRRSVYLVAPGMHEFIEQRTNIRQITAAELRLALQSAELS